MLQKLALPLLSIANLLYPNLCAACEQQPPAYQSVMCCHCNYAMTSTNYHKMEENPVLDRFWGRVQLEHASTCFAFSKGGRLQHLIHQLKYENRPDIGVELGHIYGTQLKQSSPYTSVD